MMICSDAVSFCAFYIQGNFGSYFDLVAKERRSAVRIRAQTDPTADTQEGIFTLL